LNHASFVSEAQVIESCFLDETRLKNKNL